MAFWLRFGFILSSREVKNISSSTSLPPKYESMKPNLSQKAMKLGPNDNCFTEKLLGISWIEFKLFISN